MAANTREVGKAAKRVGMFGGAFDPPHLAHRALVEAALAQLALDELRVVPTGQAWHKTRSLSPASHRLAMASLAFGDLPKVVVDDSETLREGPTYTIDTLRALKSAWPGIDLFLLIGADQARALPTWREAKEISRYATICIAERLDNSRPDVEFFANFQPSDDFGPWVRLNAPLSPVSATDIRNQVAAGQAVSPLVGAAVARYIAQHHLYSTSI